MTALLETAQAMELWGILSFMGAALVLYLTPGADMMFTLASGMRGGPRAGLAAAAGIALGVACHVLIAALGLAVLVAATPWALTAIRWAGAVYLAWLAYEAWRHAGEIEERAGRADVWRAFRRGFVTNILNPKVALFILAFLPQFAQPEAGLLWHQILILGGLLALGGLITDGAYGLFAGVMAQRLRRRARALGRLSSVIFGGLAVRLAVG